MVGRPVAGAVSMSARSSSMVHSQCQYGELPQLTVWWSCPARLLLPLFLTRSLFNIMLWPRWSRHCCRYLLRTHAFKWAPSVVHATCSMIFDSFHLALHWDSGTRSIKYGLAIPCSHGRIFLADSGMRLVCKESWPLHGHAGAAQSALAREPGPSAWSD